MKWTRFLRNLFVFSCLIPLFCCSSAREEADLVLRGGTILTMEEDNPQVRGGGRQRWAYFGRG